MNSPRITTNDAGAPMLAIPIENGSVEKVLSEDEVLRLIESGAQVISDE